MPDCVLCRSFPVRCHDCLSCEACCGCSIPTGQPSPAEIRAMTAAIRLGWDEREHRRRAGQPAEDHVEIERVRTTGVAVPME